MSDYFEWAKVSFDFSQSAFMAFVPGFQSAGQTSPCSSTYWKAWRTRSVSSTDRPTAVLLSVACWTTPSGSMMKTTVLFCLAHIDPLPPHIYWSQQLFAFGLGIYYSMVFHRTGSLLNPILAHNVTDGMIVTAIYLIYWKFH